MITETTDASLLPFNTFGIQATARKLIEYDSPDDLSRIKLAGNDFIHVGQGSNLLFISPVIDKRVLHSRIGGIDFGNPGNDGRVTVTVGASVIWDDLVAATVARGLGGLENLSLIPGETGSAAVQNIGAYGAEAADTITRVEAIDTATGAPVVFQKADCRYGYRDSVFKRPDHKRYVITHVTFSLDSRPRLNLRYNGIASRLSGITSPTVADVREAVIGLRRDKLPDPSVLGNAGSFFTNPVVETETADALKSRYPDMPAYPVDGTDCVKLSAAWLIDRSGWKGRSIGRAGVYEKQPLVLVNLGGATGADIARLARAVTDDVRGRFGVNLRPEVNYI